MPWSACYEKNNQWEVLKPMYCDDNNLHLSAKCMHNAISSYKWEEKEQDITEK